MTPLRLALAGSVALLAGGCRATLSMPATDPGAEKHPHTTIPYTGVRTDGARFEDYSAVDRSILAPESQRKGWTWP